MKKEELITKWLGMDYYVKQFLHYVDLKKGMPEGKTKGDTSFWRNRIVEVLFAKNNPMTEAEISKELNYDDVFVFSDLVFLSKLDGLLIYVGNHVILKPTVVAQIKTWNKAVEDYTAEQIKIQNEQWLEINRAENEGLAVLG